MYTYTYTYMYMYVYVYMYIACVCVCVCTAIYDCNASHREHLRAGTAVYECCDTTATHTHARKHTHEYVQDQLCRIDDCLVLGLDLEQVLLACVCVAVL